MLLIDQKILRRSTRGIRNCPFNLIFFKSLLENSLSAQNVFQEKSKYLKNEFIFINNSSFIENEFLTLIKIGVLRREVDGQGLTSRVRITPIGRKVLENNSDLFNQKATTIKKLFTCIKYLLSPTT